MRIGCAFLVSAIAALFVVSLVWVPTSPCQTTRKDTIPTLPIVADSMTPAEIGEFQKRAKELENPKCSGDYRYLDHSARVSDFFGGNVKTIRVARFLRQPHPRQSVDVEKLVQKVWTGEFQSAFCQIAWAEFTLWSIEAVLEFDDGKRGTLLTDGVHVALQDHDGRSYFFRLYPAAQ